MNVLVVSGFLGSGKTTFLLGLARHLIADGTRVAVIENEVGQVAVDGASLRRGAGVEVRELFAGCICCSLREDLGRVVDEIRAIPGPDILLIEPSGVAGPEMVTDAVRDHLGPDEAIATVQIVDAARTARMLGVRSVLPPFLERSVEVCDLVILNKTDGLDGADRTRMGEWLARRGRSDAIELDVRDGALLAAVFVPRWRSIGHGGSDHEGPARGGASRGAVASGIPGGGAGPGGRSALASGAVPAGRSAPSGGSTPRAGAPPLTSLHRQLLADCVARAPRPADDAQWEAGLADRVAAMLEAVHEEVVRRACPECSGHLKARLDPPGVTLSMTDSAVGVTRSGMADPQRGDRDAGGNEAPGAGDGSAPREVELRVQGIYSLPARPGGGRFAGSSGATASTDIQAILDREVARRLPEFVREGSGE
jgi:Ni2+-binding GTPase involved in maturation of urease and hydrogenase